MIGDVNWRSIAVTTIVVFFLFLHTRYRPFKAVATNNIETANLVILAVGSIFLLVAHSLVSSQIVSASSSPQQSQFFFGSPTPVSNNAVLEILQCVLALIPLVAFCAVRIPAVWVWVLMLRARAANWAAWRRGKLESETVWVEGEGGDGPGRATIDTPLTEKTAIELVEKSDNCDYIVC